MWNDLPDHFRKESSFPQFKNLINSDTPGMADHATAVHAHSAPLLILFALTYCFLSFTSALVYVLYRGGSRNSS